jgi:hypothetical protein
MFVGFYGCYFARARRRYIIRSHFFFLRDIFVKEEATHVERGGHAIAS